MLALRARARVPLGLDDAAVAKLYTLSLLGLESARARWLLGSWAAERVCDRMRACRAAEEEEEVALRTLCLVHVARAGAEGAAAIAPRQSGEVLRAWGEMCDAMAPAVRAHIEEATGADAAVVLQLLPVALIDNPSYEKQLFAMLGRLPPSLVRGMDALASVSGLTLSQGEAEALAVFVLRAPGRPGT